MENQDEGVSHPLANVTTASRLRTSGALTMVGSAVRVVGAILTDFGSFVGLPTIGSLGERALGRLRSRAALLPIGLRASRVGDTGALANMATAALFIGISLASLADIPAILDPTDLEAGEALGPIGLVLLSAGFLLWFVAIRQARPGRLATVPLCCRRPVVSPDFPQRPASAVRDPERQVIVCPAGRGAGADSAPDGDARAQASGRHAEPAKGAVNFDWKSQQVRRMMLQNPRHERGRFVRC
jgi:hypothetical protein